jgi:phytoene desaturase
MKKKIAIVGSGVGGLAAAMRLAYRGHDVDVYEKLPLCGGRNSLLADKGFKFDLGPSFVLMPDFFEEVFSDCKEDLKRHLDLKVLDVNYKIFYPDGDSLTVYRDSERTKHELEKLEKGSAEAFEKYIKETGRIYKLVKPLLYKCFTARTLVNPKYWPLVTSIRAFESYWQLAKKFFKSEKLLSAFTFEAMFMGVSPFSAPAFYSIISYTDHVQKIAHPIGGMYQIPLALERLAKKFGARFHYDSEIKKISKNGKFTLSAVNGREFLAENVVVNADYAQAQESLLGREIPKYKYSCSVLLIYLGLKKKVSGVEHHNLFFSSDLNKNLRQIFDEKSFPEDPSFYVHAPTVTDTSLAPAGKDIFYLLIPVPNLDTAREPVQGWDEHLRSIVFNKINRTLGVDLEDLIEIEYRFYPKDFITRYNIKNGATFGLAHNLLQSAFFRPPNFDTVIKDLYYVGASTQPGGGLPVVIASSRIVADLIDEKSAD